MTNVFIDGQAGTTGLELATRLAGRKDLTILRIPEDSRKDLSARLAIYTKADIVILCLPDQAAAEAAEARREKKRLLALSAEPRRSSRVQDVAESKKAQELLGYTTHDSIQGAGGSCGLVNPFDPMDLLEQGEL